MLFFAPGLTEAQTRLPDTAREDQSWKKRLVWLNVEVWSP